MSDSEYPGNAVITPPSSSDARMCSVGIKLAHRSGLIAYRLRLSSQSCQYLNTSMNVAGPLSMWQEAVMAAHRPFSAASISMKKENRPSADGALRMCGVLASLNWTRQSDSAPSGPVTRAQSRLEPNASRRRQPCSSE